MGIYNSRDDHYRALKAEQTPWIHEYAPRGTFDWKPITRVDGDRYVVYESETRHDEAYRANGYIWAHGMLLGKNDLSRTFVAPRDGLLHIEAVGEISFFYFNANRSCLRLMHNDRIIWPAAGAYENDFFPITYEHHAIFPSQLVMVKKGDKLRFIGRNNGDGQVDDVEWIVQLSYLSASFLPRELTLKPGERMVPEIYNETDKNPIFVSGNEEVAHIDATGKLTAVAPGAAVIRAYFGNAVSTELLVWVGDAADVRNPLDLTVRFATPYTDVGCGLGVQTNDTLQLAMKLGQARSNVGEVVASAVRFDDAGEGIKLPAEGLNAAEVECTFLPEYKGGRVLKDITIAMMTMREVGRLYHVELWYNTVSEPETFRFLYAYRAPGLVANGCYPTIRVEGFGGRVTDVLSVRMVLQSVRGYSVLLKEIDINFEDDGEEVGALRTELHERIWQPTIFADKMMIQRDKPVRVWGFGGKEGECVSVTLEGDTAQAEIKNGKWLCELPARAASTIGETMTITYRDQIFTYSDIWFGDIWWAGGQSNMGVTMAGMPKDEQQRLKDKMTPDDKIRWFGQAEGAADQKRLDVHKGRWVPVTSENSRGFSAVAINFIYELYRQTGIPMAIIYGAVGATMLEAWLPEEKFQEDDYGKRFLTSFRKRKYDGEMWHRPIGPFHQMVEPLCDFNLKGLVWYQGESNSRDRRDYPYYAERLHDMVEYWGERFRAPEMPFVASQLAPLSTTEEAVYGWCCIREAFLNAALDYDNFEVAFIGDTADETHDFHPPNKDIVGQRMAHVIAGRFYGVPGVHQGPIPNAIRQEGNALVIGFDHVGDGLISIDGEPLRHFELSEDNVTFVSAEAKIVGDTVVVSSDKIQNPFMVRYAFSAVPKVNFFNKNGFVATPFRMTLEGLYREPKE